MSNLQDPVDLRESPAYQLWLATNAWQRLFRSALEPLGITHAQHAVLVAVSKLGATGASVTQADVCRFGSLDANMASQVIRLLERRGLLARHPHPTDGRANHLVLTPSGEALAAECRRVVKPLLEAFLAPLADEQREFARMLGLITTAAAERDT